MTMRKIVGRHLIGIVALLIATLISNLAGMSGNALQASNAVVLILFILLSLWTAYGFIRFDAQMIWMPLTLYTLSSALFYGFGTLSYSLGNEATKTYLAFRKLNASPQDLVDATLLSLTGIGLAFFGILLFLFFKPRFTIAKVTTTRPLIRPVVLAWALVVFGLFFKYAIIYPAKWKLIDLVIPGVLQQLDTMSAMGFGLLAFVAFGQNRKLIPVFCVLWAIDFCLTTLAFSKASLVFAMVLPLAGYYMGTKNKFATGILTLLIVGVYALSQPMVVYARLAQIEDTPNHGYAGHAEVIIYYLTEQPEVPINRNYYGSQAWWTRFEYSAKQVYAMDLRDDGIKSSSLATLPIIFIPRILWPDKPIIQAPGKEFYYYVTGRDNNNMSISVYADMYWQFGWIGLIVFSPMLGALIAAMTTILLPEMKRRNFIYFPAVLIGFQFALLDPNQFLINGMFTTTAFFIIYLLLVRFISNRINAASSNTRPPSPFVSRA